MDFFKGNQLKSNSQNTNTNPHPNFRGTFTLFWSQDLIIPLAVLKHNLSALASPVLKLWTFATIFKESEPSLTCNPFFYLHRRNQHLFLSGTFSLPFISINVFLIQNSKSFGQVGLPKTTPVLFCIAPLSSLSLPAKHI